jgi:hypothetical protein
MWHASVWDWFSTTLMMVGFATLLGLAAYLVLLLVAPAGAHGPDDVYDEQPSPQGSFADKLIGLAS